VIQEGSLITSGLKANRSCSLSLSPSLSLPPSLSLSPFPLLYVSVSFPVQAFCLFPCLSISLSLSRALCNTFYPCPSVFLAVFFVLSVRACVCVCVFPLLRVSVSVSVSICILVCVCLFVRGVFISFSVSSLSHSVSVFVSLSPSLSVPYNK
jgi:hypothetical protein